jgi:hypothetical protein
MLKIFTPQVRLWIYGIFTAMSPLLITTGIIEGDVAGYILAVVAAVLGITNGMAAANVDRTKK